MTSVLTVADVARLRETDRTAAFRWLKNNARRHLRRRGRMWVISAKAYASLHLETVDEKVLQRLAALEETVRETVMRLDAHARELSRLRDPLF